MKKLLFIALLLVSTEAVAEDGSTGTVAAPPAAVTQPNNITDENFQQRKAKAVEHIGARIAEMQRKQACIQASVTPEAMEDCLFAKTPADAAPDASKK